MTNHYALEALHPVYADGHDDMQLIAKYAGAADLYLGSLSFHATPQHHEAPDATGYSYTAWGDFGQTHLASGTADTDEELADAARDFFANHEARFLRLSWGRGRQQGPRTYVPPTVTLQERYGDGEWEPLEGGPAESLEPGDDEEDACGYWNAEDRLLEGFGVARDRLSEGVQSW